MIPREITALILRLLTALEDQAEGFRKLTEQMKRTAEATERLATAAERDTLTE